MLQSHLEKRRGLAVAAQAKANKKKREEKKKAVLVSPPKRVLPSRGAKPKSGTSLITRGTRVEVLFDKSTWYGGVITSVLEGGSRIKIKYDDGGDEETGYPDKDIVTDYGNTDESSLSSGEDSDKDELYSADDMDIDNESTTMDFQDDVGTADWNVEEGKADEEEVATSDERPEETQVESVSSPQQLVPLDSLVSSTNGRDWVDGETSQEIFTQDDDAVDWSFDDMSAHSSINSGDKQQKPQEKNQSSADDLSANSSIVSGEKLQNLLEEASIDEALNGPNRKDTSDDDLGLGYTSFEVDDNSGGNRLLDSSDDLGAGDSRSAPFEEDNNTDKSAPDKSNQATLLLQSSRLDLEVSTSQQVIPEYLKTLRRRVGVKKVNVQTDNNENDSSTTKDSTLPAHDDIETKREYDQQKDTGDERGAISILASLSNASQSQQPSSQHDHRGVESALMLLASSHSGKDDMGSKDTLVTTRKRPSSSEQLPSPKRPRLASAAITLLAFAKQPIRFVVVVSRRLNVVLLTLFIR